MANGIIELTRFGNAVNATLYGRMVWSSVSNGTEKNTSTVTAEVQLKRPANSWTAGTWKGSITIGGAASEFSQYLRVETEWITVASATATVNHNPDGNYACYLYCKVNGPAGTSMEGSYVTGSATVTLDTIPRYASLKSVGNFTDEGNPVISYSNPAGTAVSTLQMCISLDGAAAKTAYQDVPKTGTEYTLSLTEAERNTLRAAAPNSNTLQVYVLLKTVIGSSSNTDAKPAKMNIVNADPVVSPAVKDTNSTTTNLTGNSAILVALHSTASVTINATAQKSATIKSRKVEHGTQVLTGDGTLSVTNNSIKITVTDSRGNETTKTAANTIVPYINPTCLIGNNIPETDGSFTLAVAGLFYNGSIGKTANTLTVQYRYKAAGGSYGSWTTFSSVSKSGNSYTASTNLTGLDYQTVYTFQARAIDKLHASGVQSAEKAVIAQPVFDWGQNDFKFNVPVMLGEGADILKNGTSAFAPSGYGLGVERPLLLRTQAEVDALRAFGVHEYYGSESACAGIEGITQGSILTIPTMYGVTQFFFIRYLAGATGCYLKRLSYVEVASGWNPWEWVNPPMIAGVEYRTTERWQGKPVYTKLTGCGSLGSSTTTVTTTIPAGSNLLRHHETMGGIPLPFYYAAANTTLHCDYNNDVDYKIIVMYGHSNYAGRAVTSQAWYTKD